MREPNLFRRVGNRSSSGYQDERTGWRSQERGGDWRPEGSPEEVCVHDFVVPELGKQSPYCVLDGAHDIGWMNVSSDHETSNFTVKNSAEACTSASRHWWTSMGKLAYPQARRLLITTEVVASNGSRVRLWKIELQKLADETGLTISVCHFRRAPASGTSRLKARFQPLSTASSLTSVRSSAASRW